MIKEVKQLVSAEDQSVNYVENADAGFFEARYVRRKTNYFITYLSSQTGCNRGCKFCHLTAMGQTAYKNSTSEDFLRQANHVFNHYKTQPKAREVNFNFMSRGEALANPNLVENSHLILSGLQNLALENNLSAKFNISTIMPKTLKQDLVSIFKGIQPTIYYSLYSLNEEFRKEWMPGAMNPLVALDQLKDYQKVTNKIINLHYAFIKDQNDSVEDLEKIVEAVNSRDLLCNFNIVRYNPFSKDQGQESSDETVRRNYEYLDKHIVGRVKVIDRVGFDVKASCGMFVK